MQSPVLLMAATSIEPARPHLTVTAVDNCTLVLWATVVIVTTFKLSHFLFLKRRNASFISDWLITTFVTRQQVNWGETFILLKIRFTSLECACFIRVPEIVTTWKMTLYWCASNNSSHKRLNKRIFGNQTAALRLQWFLFPSWQGKKQEIDCD